MTSDLSIKWKVRLAMLAFLGLLLGLVTLVLVFNGYRTARAEAEDRLASFGRLMAANTSAALVFVDTDAANEVLASATAEESIAKACLYDSSAGLFAGYRAAGVAGDCRPRLADPSAPLLRFARAESALRYWAPVILDGERVGFLEVTASLAIVNRAFHAFLVSLVLILSAVAVLALVISMRFEKIILAPIHALAEAMGRISRDRDYSRRVTKRADDELGILVERFNEMLDELAARDAALLEHQSHLETAVARRTAELLDSKAAAEAANHAKSEFLATMSHEIRTSLNGVLGMAELWTRTELDAAQRQYVDTVIEAGKTLMG